MNGETEQIAEAIAAYLERHPNAADTAEGISQWWLAGHKGSSRNDVLRALETLVAQGHVETEHMPNGVHVYRKRRGGP